jgi:hypothetical protein
MNRGWLICTVALAVLSAAWASEVFEPVQDSFITCWYHEGEEHQGIDDNYGDSIELCVLNFSHPYSYYEFEDAVIQFDLSDVEPAMHVIKVYLILDFSLTGEWWEFYEIAGEWSEMEITWANAPPLGEGILDYGFRHDRSTRSIELPADYVQGWVDHPAENFGFRIEEAGNYSFFGSRESDNPPQLEVYFESDDTELPVCSESYPADGESGVPPDSTIAFELTDDLAGIDTDTIQFALDLEEERTTANRGCLSIGSSSNTIIEGTLEIDDGDPLEVLCTFSPTTTCPGATIPAPWTGASPTCWAKRWARITSGASTRTDWTRTRPRSPI